MHRVLGIMALLLLVLAVPAAAETDAAARNADPAIQEDSAASDQPVPQQTPQRQALDIEEKSWSNIKALWG